MVEYTKSDTLQSLAEDVMSVSEEFDHLRDWGCRIGYQYSDHAKKSDGKLVYADCMKVNDKLKAFLPLDFVITFYEPNVTELNDAAMWRLMYHELSHVGFDETGKCCIIPHDLEDFRSVIGRWGIDWIKGKDKDEENM